MALLAVHIGPTTEVLTRPLLVLSGLQLTDSVREEDRARTGEVLTFNFL